MIKIPKSFDCVGRKIIVEVRNENAPLYNNGKQEMLGLADYLKNKITIWLKDSEGFKLPDDEVMSNFWHEKMHVCLAFMNSKKRNDEKFVDNLGALIYQSVKTERYK